MACWSVNWAQQIDRIQFVLLTGLLVCVYSSVGRAETFDEGIGASWQFKGDQFACELRQEIEFYGDARFVQRAGHALDLQLAPLRPQFAAGQVRLTRVAPAWHPLHPQRQHLEVIDHKTAPVRVSDPTASRVLGELREGFDHHFLHGSRFHPERLQVVVRGQQMRAVYSDFARCQAGLLPVNFDQISRSRVHFDFDRDELTAESVARLELIARYVRADPTINKVVLDGHTDGKGEMLYNQNLSERRANRVREFLLDAGLAAELFTVRYHGASYPVADNATEAGRADNRRTTVRLDRRPAS